MSYRTYVNNIQIFGNNESYPEWLEFIQSQGIEISEEGKYEGDITDFMGALQILEQITLEMEKTRRVRNEALKNSGYERPLYGLFDWTYIPEDLEKEDPNDRFRTSLFDALHEVIHNGYSFLPYAFYLACQEKLEEEHVFSTDGHFHCYKVKEGEKIHVSAG